MVRCFCLAFEADGGLALTSFISIVNDRFVCFLPFFFTLPIAGVDVEGEI